MLRINFVSMLLLVCTTCFSQSENIWKRKPWETLKKEKLQNIKPSTERLTEELPQPNTAKMPVLKMDISMEYIGGTNKGNNVFLVKPFRLICVSPSKDFSSNMPVIGRNAEQEPSKK